MEKLLHDHYISGLLSLERGEIECHLHMQMAVRAKTKFARCFWELVRKYMGSLGVKDMNHVGKVKCKTLTNRKLHIFKSMICYYLKTWA